MLGWTVKYILLNMGILIVFIILIGILCLQEPHIEYA